MKLTEQLIKVLETVCGDDEKLYQRFQEEILNNSAKLEKKMDEVTYLISISKDQVRVFLDKGTILNVCYDLVVHLSNMLEINESTFTERQEWYYRYAYVLIYELS